MYNTQKHTCRCKWQLFSVFAVLAAMAMLAAGCGYRLAGGGSLPGDVRRIAVETFTNRTGEIGIEAVITNDILYEITRTDKATISDKNRADAVLTGVIRSARSSSISHSAAHETSEERVTVVVDVSLVSTSGETLWSASGISASEEYTVAGDNMGTEQNKKSAVAKLSGRLAQRIYYRMTDDF